MAIVRGLKEPVDYSKIKIGRSSLSGNITALIEEHDRNHYRAKKALDRNRVAKAIETHDVKALREISNHFYLKSGIYSRLCRYMAFLYKYDWYITPQRYDNKIKDEKVVEGWYKSSIFLENCDLKYLFGNIALKVVRDGCYYGYIIKDSSAAYLQELPVNYCRARYHQNGITAVEFNIKFFDDYFSSMDYRLKVLKMFPKEFQKAYIAYKNNTLEQDYSGDEKGWFLLDPEYTVKFNLGGVDVPLFVPVVEAILDLEDAQDLDKQKTAQQLLKLIIQEMPIDKNGDLIFDVDETQALHNNVVNMVGDAIGLDVLTTFADVSVADLSDKGNVSSIDQLEKVERNVYNQAGVSQNQFNADGQIALDRSISNDEATMLDLVYQFRAFAERLLSAFNKNEKRLRYKVGILPTTIYNYKDIAKMYKEQTQIGFSKLLPQIALGHSQTEVIAMAQFENEMMKLNELFVPPQMSSTMSGNGTSATKKQDANSGNEGLSKQGAGRPEKADAEKSLKTIQNRESMS